MNTQSSSGAIVSSPKAWPVVPLPGLRPDSLGNYLASLGVLMVASRHWPLARLCWSEGIPLLVAGPGDGPELQRLLMKVAGEGAWTKYGQGWSESQRSDRGKAPARTWLWRSQAEETELLWFHSHIALGDRLGFNPILGTGGNSGKRIFAKGWSRAVVAVGNAPAQNDLDAFLGGGACHLLGDFNAGSWFSAANKMYNCGLRAYRNGQVSPWAMVLACEALPLMQGSVSRRMGARRRSLGAFPFVAQAAAPQAEKLAGVSTGEAWLPLWRRPMCRAEVAGLLARGRAGVNGRGATTPSAFAAAIIRKGIDAGVTEFRRFVLSHTTSTQTFETTLGATVSVLHDWDLARSDAVAAALALRDALPADRKNGKGWRFSGLRGPIDQALVGFASRPDARGARCLVDALVQSLQVADRNRSHRGRGIRFQLLPRTWMAALLDENEPVTPEIRLALALASLRPDPANRGIDGTAPLLAYWLGAESKGRFWEMPERSPLRRVWAASASFSSNAASVLRRRLSEVAPNAAPPFAATCRADFDSVRLLLEGGLDEGEVVCWICRFCLFAPGPTPAGFHATAPPSPLLLSPSLAVYALLKPFFSTESLLRRFGANHEPSAGTASTISALLASSQPELAVSEARRAWQALGVPLARSSAVFPVPSPQRMLAALLVPARTPPAAALRRWLDPNTPKSRKAPFS